MTIIEKEIARREALIADKSAKENKVIEMQIEIEKLTAEIAATDEVALCAEIAELKTYLPVEDVATDDVTEAVPEIPAINLV